MKLKCYTVTYYRAGEEQGYCILWGGTREFLYHPRGDTFKVQEG